MGACFYPTLIRGEEGGREGGASWLRKRSLPQSGNNGHRPKRPQVGPMSRVRHSGLLVGRPRSSLQDPIHGRAIDTWRSLLSGGAKVGDPTPYVPGGSHRTVCTCLAVARFPSGPTQSPLPRFTWWRGIAPKPPLCTRGRHLGPKMYTRGTWESVLGFHFLVVGEVSAPIRDSSL